jgi:hypothetical protein
MCLIRIVLETMLPNIIPTHGDSIRDGSDRILRIVHESGSIHHASRTNTTLSEFRNKMKPAWQSQEIELRPVVSRRREFMSTT